MIKFWLAWCGRGRTNLRGLKPDPSLRCPEGHPRSQTERVQIIEEFEYVLMLLRRLKLARAFMEQKLILIDSGMYVEALRFSTPTLLQQVWYQTLTLAEKAPQQCKRRIVTTDL